MYPGLFLRVLSPYAPRSACRMTTSTPRVAGLTVYPLKSAAGIAVEQMPLDDRGAVGDRRWLLVDGGGQAITAREC
ncbi:MOSC N-terminal beta barrel domain-containing protein, partial [Gemmatimonas sp.]|uniref:MOSC N-terminal beta barrel domain-containing protein n=1 Tax=Gemmatimonas sp. TaxID=1962908 RepID=UPI00391F12DE